MDKDENRVFYLTDSGLVYRYSHQVVESILAGMEGSS